MSHMSDVTRPDGDKDTERRESTAGREEAVRAVPAPDGPGAPGASSDTPGASGTRGPSDARGPSGPTGTSGTPGASRVPGAPGARRLPDESEKTGSLMRHDESEKFNLRLQHAVTGFVDGPRSAVEEADHVLEEVATRFTDAVAKRRRTLHGSWQSSETEDTEQLRLALRDYRELTEKLLRI